MNRQEMLKEEIHLQCDGEDCSNAENDTRQNLKDKGWKWKEGSVEGLFRITGVQCPDCVDVDIKEKYREEEQQVEDMYEEKKRSREDKDLKMSSRHKNQKTLGEAV